MGIALALLNPWIDPHTGKDIWERVIALMALCGTGAVVYGAVVVALGGVKLSELRQQFSRNS